MLDGVFNATNSEPILYLFVCGLTLLPIHIGDGMNLIDLRVRIQPSKNGTRYSANSLRDYFDQFLKWFAQTCDIFGDSKSSVRHQRQGHRVCAQELESSCRLNSIPLMWEPVDRLPSVK